MSAIVEESAFYQILWTRAGKGSSSLGMVQSAEEEIASIALKDSIVSATIKGGREMNKLYSPSTDTRERRASRLQTPVALKAEGNEAENPEFS